MLGPATARRLHGVRRGPFVFREELVRSGSWISCFAAGLALWLHAAAAGDAPEVHRLPVQAPHGAVLYEQTSGDRNDGLPALRRADGEALADDFPVGRRGWQVTGFVFNAFGRDAAGRLGAPPARMAVSIRADAGGRPAAEAVCAYDDLVAFYTGAPRYQVDVALPQACRLREGRYWVAAAFVPDATESGSAGYWIRNGSVRNAPAQARAPALAGCADWTDLTGCAAPAQDGGDFSFQVLGATGADLEGCGSGGICLRATMAVDNGDPSQCGSATRLQVIRGTPVNTCYKVTNESATTLNYHSLVDTADGTIVSQRRQPLPPGITLQYNRVVPATDSRQSTATWTSSDVQPGYDQATAPAAFVDIAAAGTPIHLFPMEGARIQMPFSFALYGRTSNALCVVKNGFALLDAPSCYGCFDADCTIMLLPLDAGYPALFPWWTLLGSHGTLYYQTLGEAPNRRFVVQWNELDHLYETRGNPYATFEMILEEASGALSFQYLNTSFAEPAHPEWDGSGTVGLQLDRTLYDAYLPRLQSNTAIDWTPRPTTTYSASAPLDLVVGQPQASATPAQLTASAAQGTTTTASLAIGNRGDYPLDWRLDGAPDRSHFPVVPAFVAPLRTAQSRLPLLAPARARAGAEQDARAPLLPFGAQPTPAYALDFQDTALQYRYVRFPDLASATSVQEIGEAQRIPLVAGDFVDDDFTREYAVDSFNMLLTVDTTTGTRTPIARLSDSDLTYAWPALKWDPSTGTLYGVYYDENLGTHLYTIDRGSGLIRLVGDFPADVQILAIAFDADGRLFGIDVAGGAFVAIDKTDASIGAIGLLGYDSQYLQSMDFDDATGTLYLAGFDAGAGAGVLYTVDTGTGRAMPVSPLPDAHQFSAFAVATPTPGCAGTSSVPWLSFNPASGTLVPGASAEVTVTFDAHALAAGTHRADVCVRYDGRAVDRLAVPVEFTVIAGDAIFADGFETEDAP